MHTHTTPGLMVASGRGSSVHGLPWEAPGRGPAGQGKSQGSPVGSPLRRQAAGSLGALGAFQPRLGLPTALRGQHQGPVALLRQRKPSGLQRTEGAEGGGTAQVAPVGNG